MECSKREKSLSQGVLSACPWWKRSAPPNYLSPLWRRNLLCRRESDGDGHPLLPSPPWYCHTLTPEHPHQPCPTGRSPRGSPLCWVTSWVTQGPLPLRCCDFHLALVKRRDLTGGWPRIGPNALSAPWLGCPTGVWWVDHGWLPDVPSHSVTPLPQQIQGEKIG